MSDDKPTSYRVETLPESARPRARKEVRWGLSLLEDVPILRDGGQTGELSGYQEKTLSQDAGGAMYRVLHARVGAVTSHDGLGPSNPLPPVSGSSGSIGTPPLPGNSGGVSGPPLVVSDPTKPAPAERNAFGYLEGGITWIKDRAEPFGIEGGNLRTHAGLTGRLVNRDIAGDVHHFLHKELLGGRLSIRDDYKNPANTQKQGPQLGGNAGAELSATLGSRFQVRPSIGAATEVFVAPYGITGASVAAMGGVMVGEHLSQTPQAISSANAESAQLSVTPGTLPGVVNVQGWSLAATVTQAHYFGKNPMVSGAHAKSDVTAYELRGSIPISDRAAFFARYRVSDNPADPTRPNVPETNRTVMAGVQFSLGGPRK